MVTNYLFSKALKYMLLVVLFFHLSPHNAFTAEEYEYIRNEDGDKLGMIYLLEGREISGELAISKLNKRLLFISCDKSRVLDNELYMRRNSIVCSEDFSAWPENLIDYYAESKGRPVILGGPPTSCGVCTEKPFQDFTISNEVTIDPEVIKCQRQNPNGENTDIGLSDIKLHENGLLNDGSPYGDSSGSITY